MVETKNTNTKYPKSYNYTPASKKKKKKQKKERKLWVRILTIVLWCLAGFVVLAFLVLKLDSDFGGRVTKEDQDSYKSRADASYYKNGEFTNGDSFTLFTNKGGSNNLYSEKGKTPEDQLPTATPLFLENAKKNDFSYTWFGHSSFMIQMSDLNILVDPMFSDRSSPFGWIGPKRFSKCPISANALPQIDAVFISHDHYDHLDRQTIQAIDRKVERYFVPLGIEKHLIRWGVSADKIQTMAWWDEYQYKGITIAATPTQHFSGRQLFDSNETLWASLVLKDNNRKIYYSADGGMDDRFEKIHQKYGDFDLAILECGQYNPKWAGVHMFPEEAVEAGKKLHATYVTPVHWGAFVLSSHAWDDPVERFTRAYESQYSSSSHLLTPEIGRTLEGSFSAESSKLTFTAQSMKKANYRWWRDYN